MTDKKITQLDTLTTPALNDIVPLADVSAGLTKGIQVSDLLSHLDADLTYTVGSGGDYTTVNAAITALSVYKSTYAKDGFTATINLLAGFVMAEQVITRNIDLSWITITSADATVTITTAAITEELIDEDNITPVFGADNAALPVIDVLFAYPDAGGGYATNPMDGVAVVNNSQVLFKPGAGVKRARNGLKVLYGSSATCYMPGLTQGGSGSGAGTVTGVDFSYVTARALHVGFGSKANLARSQLHHAAGDYGAYVIWGSHVDLYQSQIYDTTNGYAITCRDGSFANMRETQVARSKRGYHALHNSRINARSKEDPGDPASIWVVDSAKDCTEYGILASYNSHIDALEVNVSGSDARGVHASNASTIDFYQGTADNCGTYGVSATGASMIDADSSTANTSGGTGYQADRSSTINAQATTATAASTVGYSVTKGSQINAGSITGTTSQVVNYITGDGLISDSTAQKPNTWMVTSGVGASVTGTTNETTLATLTLPAGALGLNGVIRLTLNFSHTNNANVKTLRARLGGTGGTAFLSAAGASQIRTHTAVLIYNRNSQSSQIGGSNSGNATGYGQSTTVQTTGTIDTSAAQDIIISGQLATAGDNITLESYLYEYHYGA